MTVFDTFGIVSGVTDGHVPLAYILALIAMVLTAWSYARFSRESEKQVQHIPILLKAVVHNTAFCWLVRAAGLSPASAH